jgi:dienelactone hydrolase
MACVAVLACSLSAACSGDAGGEQAGPAPQVGMSLPGDFSGSGPGTLVSASSLPTIDRRLSSVSSVAARITYESTSGIDNSRTSVSGTVFAPKGTPPEGGWPVIAYGHPTTGIRSECAPSLSSDLSGLSSVVSELVKAGYVVTLPDYQGLGGQGSYHPYLDATTAGQNLIDAVRAARKLVPTASDRWLGLGVSQGGQATWAANELVPTYGQGLALAGTVSVTPPSDLTGFADAAASGTLSKDQEPPYAFILDSLSREHSDFNLDDYRHGVAQDKWDVLTACDGPAAGQVSDLLTQITPDDLRPSSPAAVDALRGYLQRASLPQKPTTAPMLVIYGGMDALIPPLWTDRALQAACTMGDVIDIQMQTDKGHGDVDASAAYPWINDRFSGVPAADSCKSFLAPDETPEATAGDTPADGTGQGSAGGGNDTPSESATQAPAQG